MFAFTNVMITESTNVIAYICVAKRIDYIFGHQATWPNTSSSDILFVYFSHKSIREMYKTHWPTF